MGVYEARGHFKQLLIVQNNIGHLDLSVQIQKFSNICSNLNSKENSFYLFWSLFSQSKLWNGALECLQIKYFFDTNHGGVRD